MHTYAIRSNDFKRNMSARSLPEAIQLEYRLARLPRYVWVVAPGDRALRTAGEPRVLGEAVLDATSSDHNPEQVALHVHGTMWLQQTAGTVRFPIIGTPKPYVSGACRDP